MQVTSMLSAGYLQPMQSAKSVQSVVAAQRAQAAQDATKTGSAQRFSAVMAKSSASVQKDPELANQEQEILSQEQNLKARLGSSAEVQTLYHYTMGEDGRRYITGASVTMRGDEEDLSRVEGVTTERVQAKEDSPETAEDKSGSGKSEGADKESGASSDLTKEEEAQVRKLKQAEQEVIAHEMAHMAAAGALGGGVSYTYTQGPDGKSYITGGEVPIQLKKGATPEETLRNMQQVQRAASAPAEPSGQDRQVAADAAAMAAQARSEIMTESASKVSQASSSDGDEDEDEGKTVVAQGGPVREGWQSSFQWSADPSMTGVSSLLASVREAEIQSQLAA